jgi:hypothetical protein
MTSVGGSGEHLLMPASSMGPSACQHEKDILSTPIPMKEWPALAAGALVT